MLKKKLKVYGSFRKMEETDSIEAEIAEWILMNWLLGTTVCSCEVIIKGCNLKDDLKQKTVCHFKNDAIDF